MIVTEKQKIDYSEYIRNRVYEIKNMKEYKRIHREYQINFIMGFQDPIYTEFFDVIEELEEMDFNFVDKSVEELDEFAPRLNKLYDL